MDTHSLVIYGIVCFLLQLWWDLSVKRKIQLLQLSSIHTCVSGNAAYVAHRLVPSAHHRHILVTLEQLRLGNMQW